MKSAAPALSLCLVLMAGCTAPSEERVTLFAASSLTDVVGQLVDEFEREEGVEVAVNFGASGRLAQQIERADRADLFFAAAVEHVDDLIAQGLLDASSRHTPIGNELVLVAARDDGKQAEERWSEDRLRREVAALAERGERLAVGHPGFVPAGLYASRWLEDSGLDDVVEDSLILGNNVREVVAQVTLGAAALGVVYRTDALAHADDLQVVCEASSGGSYGLALRPGASEAARRLHAFLTSERTLEVYRSAGFVIVQT